MLRELRLMKRGEMMAADYYVREASDEWDACERWENEGGRLRQNDEANHIAGRTQVAEGGD